jgi:hypothetical protein
MENTNSMRIALCLHGLFSSANDINSTGFDGYEHIKKHILDKGNVDVFIHSWEPDKSDLINGMYNPKNAIFEKQIDFLPMVKERGLDKLNGCPRSPESVLSHLYSVSKVMELPFKENEQYDVVIKARFDLGRINRNTSGPGKGNPYAVQCINFNPNIESDKIYMANWNHFHMGPADMWFYGSSKIMNVFKNLYQTLEEQMVIGSEFHKFATQIEGNPGDLTHAVAFYKWWMIENRIWENKITLDTIWE